MFADDLAPVSFLRLDWSLHGWLSYDDSISLGKTKG